MNNYNEMISKDASTVDGYDFLAMSRENTLRDIATLTSFAEYEDGRTHYIWWNENPPVICSLKKKSHQEALDENKSDFHFVGIATEETTEKEIDELIAECLAKYRKNYSD